MRIVSFSTRIRCTAAIAALVTTAVAAEPAERALSHYAPQPVPFPTGASYVLADGSIYIAGNDLITPVMEKLNRVFVASHPEFKFTLDLHASAMAVSGVTSGKSAMGPMGRDASFRDKDAFASRYGYPITDVQIGWDNNPSPDRFPGGKNPPGIWVNVKNPLPALTLKEVRSILTTGSEGGDITFWRQIVGDESAIGLNGGDWSKRMIHVYLPALRGLPILATTRMKWGGNPWTRRAEYLPRAEDVLNAVANDPFGIGFIGWWPDDMGWDRQAELGAQVRLLPLEDDDGHVSGGRMGDRYPLSGGLRIMVNRDPNKPMEPWIKEYLTLALSQEGQDIIASTTQSDGFLPLDREDVAAELAKVK